MGLVHLSTRVPAHLSNGAANVRGWTVRTEVDGERVGTVDDLLLDEQDRPHFYVVDLGAFRRYVLLPVYEAHPDPSQQVLWVVGMDQKRLREVPRYDHRPERLSKNDQERLCAEYRLLAGGDGASAMVAESEGPRPRWATSRRPGASGRVGRRRPSAYGSPAGHRAELGEGNELIVAPVALGFAPLETVSPVNVFERFTRWSLSLSVEATLKRFLLLTALFTTLVGAWVAYTYATQPWWLK